MPVPLHRYAVPLRAFVEGRLTAAEFEVLYLAVFKGDDTIHGPPVFNVLDRMFAEVDEYVDDPDLRARAGGTDEAHLREAAAAALKRLTGLASCPDQPPACSV